MYSTDIPIHLTMCADQGRPFLEDAVARMVCEALERSAQMLKFRLYVYCLMPDHFHLVASAADTRTDIATLLNRFKSFTTNQYWRLGGPSRRLWQPSARDRVKRPSERLETLVAYIANNPVRAGLVQCWSDWPYTKVFVEL